MKMKYTQINPVEHGASKAMSHKFRCTHVETADGLILSLGAGQTLQLGLKYLHRADFYSFYSEM
jgi:hypothetical protein